MYIPLAASFLDVVFWLIIVFFWTMIIWMFISVFADLFRRGDVSGWGKAGWVLVLVFLPLLGILIYMVVRPKVTSSDVELLARAQVGGPSPSAEIETAKRLQESGVISEEEFQKLKQKALG